MSFMYNPFPFDDPKPVNRPALKPETLAAVAGGGTPAVAKKFAAMAAARTEPHAATPRKRGSLCCSSAFKTNSPAC